MSEDRRVIVIGSGPTGAMAAHELTRQGIPVLMLESGRDFQPGFLLRMMGRNFYRRVPEMQSKTGYTATGDPQTDWYFNLAPGGLSNQWTGAVPRFAPQDFSEGERLHERYRWPLTYEELVPYYEQVEPLMDITAAARDVPNLPAGKCAYHAQIPADWQNVAKVAEAHGQGLTTMPLADGPSWLLVKRGTAFNSFSNLVRRLSRSPHFQLMTGAHVLKLELAQVENRVEAVLYQDRATGSQHRLPCRAVVLACGAINTAKLLFHSACPDFPDGVGNSEGLLGRYLHDHPREWWVFDVEKPISLLSPSAYLTRAPHKSSPPLLAAAWTLGVVSTKDKILSRFARKGQSIGVQVFGTMIPTEQHYARPSAEQKDAFGQPLLDLCIRYDSDAIQNMLKSRERLLCLMEEAGYPSRIREVVPQLFPGSSVHYGGTARMHEARKYGVVDAWNRVFDVPNALVCDAGCFPTACEKNPTLTAMALAARAADRLARDLKAG